LVKKDAKVKLFKWLFDIIDYSDKMGTNYTVILEEDEEIFPALEKFAKENEITYGMIISAKGAIKHFDIISHGQRGTVEKMNYRKEFEVNALSGKIDIKGGEVRLKMNALVSSSGFTPISGELLNGKAAGSLQIVVRKVDMKKMIEA
jgi:predicted DNA-binding protein with PD1-like motif